ncbi:MAG: DUF4111 domain-containing protein, partial [Chloroflexota bacterium]|nr:DUF4111 domain-containing protein [Chloroflexota bacterium]
ATGDFDPHSSDVDFVVVTDDPLTDEHFLSLVALHGNFAAGDSPWAVEIECLYIPVRDLRRYDGTHPRYPRVDRGSGDLFMAQHDVDWVIQRYVLREYGVALLGPPANTLIDPVEPDDLRRALVELMDIWWEPMVHDPSQLRHLGYRTYAILTMCRVLYTLQHGTVVSKPVAARWAMRTEAASWAGLIEKALAWRKEDTGGEGADLDETADLIGYTAACCRAFTSGSQPRG